MEAREEKAERLFREGFNCSQSVFLAFSDKYGISDEIALRISSSFGGGMGRMREVCGTFSAMLMVAGLETGSVIGRDSAQKLENYQMVRELAADFKEKNGTIICRELLGIDKGKPATKGAADESAKPEERTEEYYKKRPCITLIREAVRMLEKRGY